MLKNNKGFSLIELMVVVAIIAILATIAVPSYQGFQAKARQKEGFALLNAYFTSAQASSADIGLYPGNFVASGFAPAGQLGYRVAAAHNPSVTAGNAPGPGLIPEYGANDSACLTTANALACTCAANCTNFKTWTERPLGAIGRMGPMPPAGVSVVVDTTFLVHAAGVVSAGAAARDEYSINQNKLLVMVTNGLN